MSQTTFFAIGMMSGTSLDGLDICYVKLQLSEKSWRFNILKSATIPYSNYWKNALETAPKISAKKRSELSKTYSTFLGQSALTFMAQNEIQSVDYIASHGHTVFHQPENKITVQIGNEVELYNTTKITTICDFRQQDVLLGGQGAPLVPVGDQLLFSQFDACLNLGGFANVSLEKDGQRVAFDICPVNIVLNALSEKLSLAFDESGNLAKKGKLIPALLEKLNALEYYQKPLPKSLGREWVEENISPLFIEDYAINDLLHTFTEHATYQIWNALKNVDGKILVTGGGAFNTYFLKRLKARGLENIQLPEQETINQKEALVFAFLGALRLRNETNCLQSVTGANRNHSSGRIYRDL